MALQKKNVSAPTNTWAVLLLMCLCTFSCDNAPGTDSNNGPHTDRPWQLRPPMVVTEPDELIFTEASDIESQDDDQIVFTEKVSFFNTGEMPLKIISVQLADDDDCTFRISSTETSGALLSRFDAPDDPDRYDLMVSFSPPTRHTYQNTLIIETNSARQRIVTIPVSGQSNTVSEATSSCNEDATVIFHSFDFCDDTPAQIDISGHRKYKLYREDDILGIKPAYAELYFEQIGNEFTGTILVPDLSWDGVIWGTVSGIIVCFTGFVPTRLSPSYIEGRFEHDDDYNMNDMFIVGYSESESSNGASSVTGICIDEDDAVTCTDGRDNDSNGRTDCEEDKCAEIEACNTSK